jgi:hypothetical protein
MKKVVFGIVWCIALYFVCSMVVGGIAGGIAGSRTTDARTAARSGREAGAKAVRDNHGLIVAGAILLSAIGSSFGLLPGTRQS